MILPYSGCFTRRSTRTTTVLSPLSDTTVPVRTRFGIPILSSTLRRSIGSFGLAGALMLKRLDARDGAAHLANTRRLLELVGGRLEAEVELLALQLQQLRLQLVVGLDRQIVLAGHLTFPLRPGFRRGEPRPWS